ncbi:MAG: tetratricopeptide repeat protein [Fibrobacteria bacterium]|nr:tetratricopeptide repeat protein [Fibrobacteria bacterium]
MKPFPIALSLLLVHGAFADEDGSRFLPLPEILRVIDTSAVKYSIEKRDGGVFDVRVPQRPQVQTLDPSWHLVTTAEGAVSLDTFVVVPAARPYLRRAEEAVGAMAWDSALVQYRKAWDLDTTNAKILTWIGNSYFQVGQLDSARRWLERAVDRNPIDYQAYFFLSDLALEQGDRVRARREFARALLFARDNMNLRRFGFRLLDPDGLEVSDGPFRFGAEVSGSGAHGVSVGFSEFSDAPFGCTLAALRYDPAFEGFRASDPSGLLTLFNAVLNQAVRTKILVMGSDSTEVTPTRRILADLLDHDLLFAAVWWEFSSTNSPVAIAVAPPPLREQALRYIEEYLIRPSGG